MSDPTPHFSALAAIEHAVATHATSLDLRGQHLDELPAEIARLPWLEVLDLSGNRLRTLPPEIGTLTKLGILRLVDNNISILPKEFGLLSELRELHIANNDIHEFPAALMNLTQLMVLNMAGNQLSGLPHNIDNLASLQVLNLSQNALRDIPGSIVRMIDLERAADLGPQFGIYLRGNPLPPPLWDFANLANPASTKRIFQYIRTEEYRSKQPANNSAGPNLAYYPEIPIQGFGPHFEIREDGVVDFVPSSDLDAEGNNIKTLQALHPELQRLVTELMKGLSEGNSAHHKLRDRVADYREMIDQPLSDINFDLLYVSGVRYDNALKAASDGIASRELPPFGEDIAELTGTLARVHGRFILATNEGIAAIDAEARYQRGPAEEKAYRGAILDIAQALKQQPDVIAPRAAELIEASAAEIGTGRIPERSGAVAAGMTRNATIAIASAAVLGLVPAGVLAVFGAPIGVVAAGGAVGAHVANLIGGEALKQTKSFRALRDGLTVGLDRLSEFDTTTIKERFKPHAEFVRKLAGRLRLLAANDEGLRWLRTTTDWVSNRRSDEVKPLVDARNSAPLAPFAKDLETITKIRGIMRTYISHARAAAAIESKFPTLDVALPADDLDAANFAVTFPTGYAVGLTRSINDKKNAPNKYQYNVSLSFVSGSDVDDLLFDTINTIMRRKPRYHKR